MKTKSFTYPVGAIKKKTLLASTGAAKTSVELIADTEFDASFFRELESQGILLNEEQVHAVRALDGPVLVLAGAGSGKTRVLTVRTAYMLRYRPNISIEQLLILTFSKKAAKELKERFCKMLNLSEQNEEEIACSTFHSIFLRLLRENGWRKRIMGSEAFKELIMKRLMKQHKLDLYYTPVDVLSAISSWKNLLLFPHEMEPKSKMEKDYVKLYTLFEEWKEENNYMDFDDILTDTYLLLNNNPDLLHQLRSRYQYIAIDEFQDTCKVQFEIIRLLTDANSNVLFVGDEDQLIYGFRNASPEFILNLSDHYPAIKQLRLTMNYRSTSSIVGLANKVISFNTQRIGKTSYTANPGEDGLYFSRPFNSDEEAEWITDHINQEVSEGTKQFTDFAVLFRTHSSARSLTEQLLTSNVPFVLYGSDQLFYDHPLVKPLVSHLRLAAHMDDIEAIGDIAPTLFISRESALMTAESFMESQFDRPALYSLLDYECKSFQKQRIVQRIDLIKRITPSKPLKAIQLLRSIFYDAWLNVRDEESSAHQAVLEILSELEASAERFNDIRSFVRFIDDISERFKQMEEIKEQADGNTVKIMTIHQSKGLEFPTIFLIGASEKLMPHAAADMAEKEPDYIGGMDGLTALEEERRIFYVALTRAQQELFICSPRTVHNKEVDVSRFLLEAYAT